MTLNLKKLWKGLQPGTKAQWAMVILAFLSFILLLTEKYPLSLWFAIVIIVSVVLAVLLSVTRGKTLMQKVKEMVKWVIKLLITSMWAGIVSWLMIVCVVSSMYAIDRISLSPAVGEVFDDKGVKIAKETENKILAGVREGDEKVILTLVDSETVRNRIYREALGQAEAKGYIDFVDGRYQTPTNWISLTCTFAQAKLIFPGDEGESILMLYSEVLQLLTEDKIEQIFKEIIPEKSILLTEVERNSINDRVNKHDQESDLYRLMYLVLSDPNIIRELEYDIEYYEIRGYKKDDVMVEDEIAIPLSDGGPTIIIQKTVHHLSWYDKIGVVGSYLDYLRFQRTQSIN